MNSTDQYYDYLVKHINSVYKCCEILTGVKTKEVTVDDLKNKDYFGHDKSKLTVSEFIPYRVYFYDDKNKKLPKTKSNFDKAWCHHQKENPHHWQFWCYLSNKGELIPLEIPMNYIDEMVADWGSFSYQKGSGDELRSWFDSNKDKMKINPVSMKIIETKVQFLADELDKLGETK